MSEWSVQVNGVGVIGTLTIDDETEVEFTRRESLTREALTRFGRDGPRCVTGALPLPYIYEDDDFSVSKL